MDDPEDEPDNGHGYGADQAGSSQGPRSTEAYLRLFEQGLGAVQLSPEQPAAVAQVFAGSLGDCKHAMLSSSAEGGGWLRAKGPRGTRKTKTKDARSGMVCCVGARSGPKGV